MNYEEHSPCLSFNSIFTSCQTHLGAFHHHCSPSTIFSSMGFSLPVNVWWTPLWGSVWGLKVPLSRLFLCLLFSPHFPPLLMFAASPQTWRFLFRDSSRLRDSLFFFPQGKFGSDWIRQEKVGHWLWSVYSVANVKVKLYAGVFLRESSASQMFSFFLFIHFQKLAAPHFTFYLFLHEVNV